MAESRPGPATTGRSSVQQSTEQDANSSYPSPSPPHPLPLKRKKKEPGTPTWKNVVVLKSSDVRKIGDKVLMPFTTQMSTIKKSLIPRFQKVEISSAMTKMEVKAKLEEVFPYLRQQRFFCAKAVEGGTRLDFYGEPSIWDGKLIKKILPGNYVLYILTYEENDDEQDPTVSNLSTNTCSLHNPMVTTGSSRERDQVPQRVDSRDLSGHVSSVVEPIQCSSDCGTVPSCSSSQQSPAVNVEVNRAVTRACTNNATENEETSESNNESQSSDWPSDSGIEGTDNPSVDERGNGNLDLGVTIDPPAVPLQGGPFCCFDFTPMLPLWFNSGTATFGELGAVELSRHNNSLIGRHIPARSEAGSETVILRSEYGVFLGQTEIQYYDEVQRTIEFLVGNKKHHRRLFQALASISESPTGDGQICGSCGSTQPLKTLKLSVYAAAKFGAKQFLKTVFESKAGRKVFNAYKDHPPLPEVIAWKYGHEETANYLEDITIRFSREANFFPEERQEIDWQELIALSDEAKENQELCIACDDENHRAECDVIIDTGYLGDTETSSSTMSSPSRSDSEIDDTGFCFKEASSFKTFDVKACRSKLAEKYRRITPVLSSKVPAVKLSLVRETKNPAVLTENELTRYWDLFTPNTDGVVPKRILVRGSPGIGKTTFIRKLAYDWATEIASEGTPDKQAAVLRNFELLITVNLKEVSNFQSLQDVINHANVFADEDKSLTEGLLHYITNNQEKVLFVFDGFDEYRCGRDSEVYEIFSKGKLRNCSVLLTSRISEADELRACEDLLVEDYRLVMEYSQEQLNYFRLCYVAFNLVPAGLRQIFKNEWDFRYKTTPLGEWKDTPQNGRDFYNNESKASRKKNGQCLATIQNGYTAEWDCTCLFFAILYSDSIGKTLSPAVYKDVDDIRQVQNEIAHITDAKLTDADFQASVDRLINAFTFLDLSTTEIQEVKKQTAFPTRELEKIRKQALNLQAELDQAKSDLQVKESELQRTEADLVSAKEENKAFTQEKSAKLQPFCILTSRPPHNIIRRSHDIERITNKMEELYSGANAAVTTVYLSGLPGCGKSQLAREIGQQFFSERSDDDEDLVFVGTLKTESVETLAGSYMTLGRHLGITEYALTSLESLKREKPIEAIQQLHRLILPKVSKFSKWLIIVDNVTDLRLVRGLLPQTGSKEWGHGQLLITTQDSATIPLNAPHTYHESLSRGMMLDEAVKLLETISQLSEQEEAKNVAELLDYQPLALAAAASYVQTAQGSSNCDWKAYLHDISTYRQRKEIETVLATENSSNAKTLMTAVEMAVHIAVDVDEVLRQAFSFLSLCAHDDIPLETVSNFVKAQVKNQPEELMKAKIETSSLLLVHSEEGDERTYLCSHKIVHEVLKRSEMFNLESKEIDQIIGEAVKIFKSQLEENLENYAFLKKLRPHCESLLNHMASDFSSDQSAIFERFTPFIDLEAVIDWLGTLASICHRNSYFFYSKNVVDLACNLVKNIGETPSAVLIKARIFDITGAVHVGIGDYSLAKKFLENALEIRLKIWSADHGDVATSYNNLASVYRSMGDFNRAKEFYENALEIRLKIVSENHGGVGTSYNNLASVYESLGAKEFYEKALMIRRKVSHEDHGGVASCLNNLGEVYESLEEYTLAEEFHQKALMMMRKIFSEDHGYAATCCNNPASVYESVGEYDRANKELREKVLTSYKKNFGEDHAHVATSYDNLASVYKNLEEYNRTKEFYEKALMIRRKMFGEDHGDVATSYDNLASVCNILGEYNQARELHKKALMIRTKIFGEDHAHVATSYDNLASVYKNLGEYNRAKELYEKALMIRRKIFGEDHVDVATSYYNLTSL